MESNDCHRTECVHRDFGPCDESLRELETEVRDCVHGLKKPTLRSTLGSLCTGVAHEVPC